MMNNAAKSFNIQAITLKALHIFWFSFWIHHHYTVSIILHTLLLVSQFYNSPALIARTRSRSISCGACRHAGYQRAKSIDVGQLNPVYRVVVQRAANTPVSGELINCNEPTSRSLSQIAGVVHMVSVEQMPFYIYSVNFDGNGIHFSRVAGGWVRIYV